MEEYEEVFEYDNSEPDEAWWNEETNEFDGTVSGNEASDTPDAPEDSVQLGELLETLTGTSTYGTMGDYYNQQLGCYVFPGYEVYEYFIDTDAYGGEWMETLDGHYIPVQYLEAYETYISVDEDAESFPTESELQNMETLENIRGILSVIKENNATFYDEVLDYQQETLDVLYEISAKEEGILYGTVTECVLLGVIAGSYFAHVFWGRMRVG